MSAAPTGVAVVGTGYWGPALVRNFAALPTARVLHLVDKDVSRARSVRDRLVPTAAAHDDFASALSDPAVRAVVIATPAPTHFELAAASLRAGKHTLVEKPLAMTVARCHELEALAHAGGLVLMVGHVFRFNVAVERIKHYVDSGDLGDIHYVHSRRVNLGRVQADINALWSFAPHDFSIVNYWMSDQPISVAATGFSYIQKGVEDVIFCTVEYPGGRGAHLHMSWLDPRKVREMTVVGTRRMAVFDDISNEAKVRLYDSSVSTSPAPPESFADWQVDIRHGDVSIPRLGWIEPLRSELDHFLSCVRDGIECRVPGSNGRAITEAIVAAQESLKRGGIAVPLAEVR
jgi:predicted dehydrogenase